MALAAVASPLASVGWESNAILFGVALAVPRSTNGVVLHATSMRAAVMIAGSLACAGVHVYLQNCQ
jgi:hypothetical protein